MTTASKRLPKAPSTYGLLMSRGNNDEVRAGHWIATCTEQHLVATAVWCDLVDVVTRVPKSRQEGGRVMNESRSERSDLTSPSSKARDFLRRQLIYDAVGNCLPLVHVNWIVTREHLSESIAGRQDLVLSSIRSLLDEGLMDIGEIVGGSDERIDSWGLPPAAAVERLREVFVDHYDEPDLWEYTVWLGLTPAGETAAQQLESQGVTEESE